MEEPVKILKNIFSQLHVYVLWFILSVVIWGFVFGIITDAPASKKIVIFADADIYEEKLLDIELEKNMPDGIRQIRVHSFNYVMFNDSALLNADIYIIPGSRAAEYISSCLPLDTSLAQFRDRELLYLDGTAYGIKFDSTDRYFDFSVSSSEKEDVWIFFGINSKHAAPLNSSPDDAAISVAECLMNLNGWDNDS